MDHVGLAQRSERRVLYEGKVSTDPDEHIYHNMQDMAHTSRADTPSRERSQSNGSGTVRLDFEVSDMLSARNGLYVTTYSCSHAVISTARLLGDPPGLSDCRQTWTGKHCGGDMSIPGSLRYSVASSQGTDQPSSEPTLGWLWNVA